MTQEYVANQWHTDPENPLCMTMKLLNRRAIWVDHPEVLVRERDGEKVIRYVSNPVGIRAIFKYTDDLDTLSDIASFGWSVAIDNTSSYSAGALSIEISMTPTEASGLLEELLSATAKNKVDLKAAMKMNDELNKERNKARDDNHMELASTLHEKFKANRAEWYRLDDEKLYLEACAPILRKVVKGYYRVP